MCRAAMKCCNILKWYTKVEYLPSQITNFYRMKRKSCHCPSRALHKTPSFQSTFIFLLMTKRYHHFLSSFWFLNHCSPVFSKPVAAGANSSVTSNFRGPIFTRPFLKLLANCKATSLLCTSNFCKNWRNPESRNSARLLRYSTFCSTLLRDEGSLQTGGIAA